MTSAPFEFATVTRIVFGAGKAREAPGIARTFGTRALLVTGGTPARADWLHNGLEGQGIQAEMFCVPGEPDIALVERGVALARAHRAEFVIALGGGSAIDAAKAIAAMLANPGELLDYLEVVGRGAALKQPSAPLIAIPTTAGTGAEVTRNSVLAVPGAKVKVSLCSAGMLPKVAIVDPQLTYSLPPTLTAFTGMDALTQLIEPFVSSRANPMVDALCLEGLRRVARSLPVAFSNGADTVAREDMALASLFGGLALANAGLGAVHGFAGPIGGMFPAAHGAVCAALLAPVMETNLQALAARAPENAALARYAEVGRILTGNARAGAGEGVAWVQRLTSTLQIPPLRHWGITPADLSAIASQAARASSMKANPLELTAEEMESTLRKAL